MIGVVCNMIYLLLNLFQPVDDKIALVLRSDQRKLGTPAIVSETLIRLATDDLMSPNLSQKVSLE